MKLSTKSITVLSIFIVCIIIGKCFVISKMDLNSLETINVFYNEQPTDFKITKEYNLGENNTEKLYLQSSKNLRWVKIYEYILYHVACHLIL